MVLREAISAFLRCPEGRQARDAHRHAAWWTRQLGRHALDTLTADTVCATLDRLTRHGRSPSTAAFYLRFLRRMTAWGTAQGYWAADPCRGLELPKERTPALRVLTEEEERRLCAALGEPYASWVRLAILTGLKQSEQFTARWRDVDLERGTLLLPAPTPEGVMATDLCPEAVTLLRELRTVHPPSLWVFPDLANPYRAVNIHAFYCGRWVSAVARAGIAWCTWKDLRNTCGVRLAQQGLSINEITRRLRQRETRQAYRYRRISPDGSVTAPRPTQPRAALFGTLDQTDLRALLLRDLTTAPLLFREAAQLYAVHHLGSRPTREHFERIYRQFWTPWSERPLSGLTKKEILVWYWSVSATPAGANKALTLLRALFGFVARLDLFHGVNPAVGIPRYRATARARFLTVEELHRFMAGLDRLAPKPRAFLTLLIMTGCRRGEALRMRWTDLDLTLRLWRKDLTKNGTPHLVPLPVQAVTALQRLPRVSEWVFASAQGRHWSDAWAEDLWGTLRRRWGLDDVCLHDLRRTTASYLSIAGENLQTVQNVLNHQSLGPTSIYARLNVMAVDRALQAQADRFTGLHTSTPALPGPPHERI